MDKSISFWKQIKRNPAIPDIPRYYVHRNMKEPFTACRCDTLQKAFIRKTETKANFGKGVSCLRGVEYTQYIS